MLTARSKWSKPEKTLPWNKKQLTRKQHVSPCGFAKRPY